MTSAEFVGPGVHAVGAPTGDEPFPITRAPRGERAELRKHPQNLPPLPNTVPPFTEPHMNGLVPPVIRVCQERPGALIHRKLATGLADAAPAS